MVEAGVDTFHLPVNIGKHLVLFGVKSMIFRLRLKDLLDLQELGDVAEGDLTQPHSGDPGRAAGVRVDGILHLADLDAEHVGKDLAPNCGLRAAADDMNVQMLYEHRSA